MKIQFLLVFCTLWAISGALSIHLPISDVTKQHISELLAQLVKKHHIPCLVSGFQVYSTSENGTIKGQQRWTWADPRGFANVEEAVKCSTQSMFRVASVSKAIGSGLVASLVEQGKLHWDDDVNKYVPETVFSKKSWNGTQVTITLRQLITHLSGLRHTLDKDLLHDWGLHITNSTQTVRFFAHDPLLSKPGTHYHYSNNGWQLLGAVVEAVEKRSYHLVINEYMRKIGMKHAQQDDRNAVIANRGSQYHLHRDAKGHIELGPAPITDNLRPFPHWPAGGVLSDIDDIITYGDRMLRSSHGWPEAFLKSDTVHSLWDYKPPVGIGHSTVAVNGHQYSNVVHRYAMGWERVDFPVLANDAPFSQLEAVYHLGGVGGASAVVLIFPQQNLVFGAIANVGGVGDFLSVAASIYQTLAHAK